MLIISGLAQSTKEHNMYSKGDRHLFTMFAKNETLDDNLDTIEEFFNDLGWDDIIIEEAEVIKNSQKLNHSVLKGGFEKAIAKGLSVVINNVPLAKAA